MTVTGGPCVITNEGGTCAFNGIAYSNQYTASGGLAPYVFTVSAGTLPTGLSMSAAGLLSGTPTVNGTYNFTVKATDANMASCTLDVTMDISNTLFLDPRTFNPEPIDPKNLIWTASVTFGSIVVNFADGANGTFSFNDSVIDCLNFGPTSDWEGESYICNPCPDWTFHIAIHAQGILQPPGDCPGPVHYDPRVGISIISNSVHLIDVSWATAMPATYFMPAGGAFDNLVEADVLLPFFNARHLEILIAGRMGTQASGTIIITPRMRP